jgi:hypothetical protein
MTDFSQYTDQQLAEAITFYRSQRNGAAGLNEAAHMRAKNFVRLAEAEQARRLNEEKPNHYIVTKRKNGEYGVSQDVGNNVWDHSYHHGTHKTVDAAKAWAVKHAGKYPHKIEVKEETNIEEAVQVDKKNYSWGKMITVRHGSSHSFPLHPEHQEKIKNLKDGESTAFKDETGSHVTAHREGDKVHLKLRGANQKTTVAHSHFTEEVNQIDELSKGTLGSYVNKAARNMASNLATSAKEMSKPRSKRDGAKADVAAKKYFKRMDGISAATRKLTKEESEQLDEIGDTAKGRKALKAVISRAPEKAANLRMKADILGRRQFDPDVSHENSEKYGKASDTAYKKYQHTVKSAARAVDRLTKEEIELDEVSASTLRNYIDKSRADKKAAMKDRTAAEKNVKTYGMASDKKERDDAARRVGNRNQGISVANKKLGTYPTDKAKAKVMAREEVEQIDEISTELKKRYVEKGAEDVVDRFTGRGKYERPRNPANFTKTGRVKKSALNRPEAVKYREKLDNRRDIVNKVSQEVHGKKRFGEEFEINEASDLRITKIYNKWPKKATYAVHTPDRKYFKEFDSMEAAKAHHDEKTNNK